MTTSTRFALTLVVLAGVGFLDASYLTIEHFRGAIPPCTIEGCETVLSSEYAAFYGIPVALFGVLYYLTVFGLAMRHLDTRSIGIFRMLAGLSLVGLLASGWFVYVQAFIIGAFCIYCFVSAGTSTLIFLAAQTGLRLIHRNPHNN